MANGNYTPDGWDAGWAAAKARVSSSPMNVVVIGDSVLNGGNASNLNTTSFRALLRNFLIQSYSLYADFFPNFQNSFTGWGSSGANTNFRWGFGFTTVPNGSGGTNTMTFTSPYTCSQMDVIYLDQWPGTWSYNLDGAGNVIVTNQNNNANSAQSYAIKRLQLQNLRSDVKHSVVFASQSASNTCAILGVICYPNGPVGGGVAYAPLTYAGTLLTDKISAYAFNAGPVPSDMCWIMQGAVPLSYDPGTPSTAVTAGAPSAGGSVDVGTHYYAYTYYGGFGETTIGTSTSAASVVASGGTQTVALSTIANAVTQADCPYSSQANKNLYRTKASGTGTPGSSTNPFFFLSQIAGTATTFSDTVADASLTAQQPPTSYTWTPAGAFGFPCSGTDLAIIGMGVNDISFNYSATNVSNYELALKRLCRHIKRGGRSITVPPSIVILIQFMNDQIAGDGGTWASSNNTAWSQYVESAYRVARQENCAILNIDSRWQPFAVANGFVTTDVHPTDAGNADEFAALQQLLWLG